MIVLQIGQCGIQVGQQLFKVLEQEYKGKEKVDKSLQFKQIIVDTERKTWRQHQRASTPATPAAKPTSASAPKTPPPRPLFPTTYLDSGTSGRGNNWAHGYWDITHLEKVMESIRREVERGDRGEGVVLLHSVAGGTGAGFGSRIAEEYRDAHPKGNLMSYGITPFSAGETSLQHYNSLLSLGWVQRYADMVGIFSNDAVMSIVSKQYGLVGKATKTEKITLDDLNEYIARSIAGHLLPITPIENADGKLVYKEKPTPSDFQTSAAELAPAPKCKIVHFASSTVVAGAMGSSGPGLGNLNSRLTAAVGWDDLRTNLLRNIPPLTGSSKRHCIAARLQARGVIGPEYWTRNDQFEDKLLAKLGLVCGPDWFDVRRSSMFALDLKSPLRSLDLAYNGSDALTLLTDVHTKAQRMYAEKAYLHWYERYGGTEVFDVFEECFETVAGARDAYVDFLGGGVGL